MGVGRGPESGVPVSPVATAPAGTTRCTACPQPPASAASARLPPYHPRCSNRRLRESRSTCSLLHAPTAVRALLEQCRSVSESSMGDRESPDDLLASPGLPSVGYG